MKHLAKTEHMKDQKDKQVVIKGSRAGLREKLVLIKENKVTKIEGPVTVLEREMNL